VSRGIDDQQTGDLDFVVILVDDSRLVLDGGSREEGGTDLLSDTSSFALLDRSLTDLKLAYISDKTHLVEELGFTGIDVSENTTNRTS